MTDQRPWPTLRSYEGDTATCVAMPIGGIGTGTVSIGGRGDLHAWELVNRPAKGFTPKHSFFAIRARQEGSEPVARILEGPISGPAVSPYGTGIPNAGLPRFRRSRFDAAYPLAQVHLDDPDVPLVVRLEAFNPLVPSDAGASSFPVAVLRYRFRNDTDLPTEVSVAGSLENFIGFDGTEGNAVGAHTTVRRTGSISGVLLGSTEVDDSALQWGTMALATTSTSGVTFRTHWTGSRFGGPLLDYWDDLLTDGALDDREAGSPRGAVCVKTLVEPGDEGAVTFLLTWHFPNRPAWTPTLGEAGPRVGNHYTTQFADAWAAAEAVAAELPELEERTVRFVRAVVDSNVDLDIKDAALSNMSTLRTQTCFRTEDGMFFGYEGSDETAGCCYGSCTHVWNYELTLPYLFGDLASSMRDVEFRHTVHDNGAMSFRVGLPLDQLAQDLQVAAADGQFGAIVRMYREWQLSGDDRLLVELWPNVRRAVAFAWMTGGWDPDGDGLAEGVQHNTYDVDWFGPNPQVAGWYLAALRAAEEMALHVGDPDFAATCRARFESGRARVDAELFNGEYYEQRGDLCCTPDEILPILRHPFASEANRDEFQLARGCATDQLIGEHLAITIGLGGLLDPDHVSRTLDSILRYNVVDDFATHLGDHRAFAVAGESGVVACSYPNGRPESPFPYAFEVWTGLEYTLAAHLFWLGRDAEATGVVRAVRARHDGRRRNPFDEFECGHHYVRAMAAWGCLLAVTGFRYSAVDATVEFRATDAPSTFVWSTGYGWGTFTQQSDGEALLSVEEGYISVDSLTLIGGSDVVSRSGPGMLAAGESAVFRFGAAGG